MENQENRTMDKTFRVKVLDYPVDGVNEVIYLNKTYIWKYNDFMSEIFRRLPDLKNKKLRIFYKDSHDDCVTIYNSADFNIFSDYEVTTIYIKYSHDATNTNSPSTSRPDGFTMAANASTSRSSTAIRATTSATSASQANVLPTLSLANSATSTACNVQNIPIKIEPTTSSAAANSNLRGNEVARTHNTSIRSDRRSTTATPLNAQSAATTDLNIYVSLQTLLAMGFDNTDGALLQLLRHANGNIQAALDLIIQ